MGTASDKSTASDEVKAKDTTDAVVVQRVGSVDQTKANREAKARNKELVDGGVNSESGYIGADATDLAKK